MLLTIPLVGCMLFLPFSLLFQGNCANLAGSWALNENATLRCTLTVAGQSETFDDSLSARRTVTINQNVGECSFRYEPGTIGAGSLIQYSRSEIVGTINGNSVAFSGGTLIPGTGTVFTENTFGGTGQLSGNQLTLSGSGNIKGTTLVEGGQTGSISCTLTSAAVLTKSVVPTTIQPTGQSLPLTGGTGIVNVTAATGVAWVATVNSAWISITSGSSGSGNGMVTYSVAPYMGSSARSGTLTIAGLTFTITQAGFGGKITEIYFPRLVTRQPGAGEASAEYTGIAVANLGAADASLNFTAFDKEGVPVYGPAISNPKLLALKAGEQLPFVDYQVFGSGLTARGSDGWCKLESTGSNTVGFFLVFNDDLTVLDGADVSTKTLASFVFPEIEDQGFTNLHIANPGGDPATITLELIKSDGTPRVPQVAKTLVSNGALSASITELFPGAAADGSDYVRATSNRGVVPFAYMGKTALYVQGLNGQDVASGATRLYSPQYAVGGKDWRTTLSVINLDSKPGTVVFRFIKDDGTQLGSTKTLPIAARGKIRVTDQKFFLDPGDTLAQGYVEITSDGVKLSGAVVFGDPERSVFSSSLPLAAQYAKSAVFSQVASDATYFTGVAILNPNDAGLTATIEVFSQTGTLVATKQESIAARQRRSLLLTQYFPALAGKTIRSGYIKVRADAGFASFGLFGTKYALSAIPPQILEGTNTTITNEGPIAYYPFSGNANDLSGNNRHGVVNGAIPTADRFGNANSAYYFNGTSAYINLADSETGNLRESGTLAFWCKADEQNFTDGQYHKVFEKDLGSWWAFYVPANSSNLSLTISPDNRTSYVVNVLSREQWLNRWAFVAVVKSGRTYEIYADGQLVASRTFAVDQIVNSQTTTWGRSTYWKSQYFRGALDDTRIYNRALTAAEIQILYHEGGWNP
jgi:hypothetical protein